MGYPNDFIYLISAWSSLLYYENYMDKYVKTMQSDEFNYYKLNWAQIIRRQWMIFQWKYFLNALLRIPICILIKQVLCIYGETNHLES